MNVIKNKHPYYTIWRGMKSRCYVKCNVNYSRYGNLGITVSDSWLNDFWTFVKDMGERPIGFTLDRIDTHKGYCKENCRWVSVHKQALNTKSFEKARPYRVTGINRYQVRLKSRIGKYVCKTFITPIEAYIYYMEHKQDQNEID